MLQKLSIKLIVIAILLLASLVASAPVMSWIPPYSPGRENAIAKLETARVQDGLSHVALQFWEPNGANVQKDLYQTSDALIIEIRDTAQAHGIKALLCVYNGDSGWNWAQATNAFVNNKTAFINALIAEMNRLSLDGIEIDLEGPNITSASDGTNFISFISALSAAMPAGKELTLASFHSDYHTPGPRHWDQLLPLVDAITTMGYAEIGINGTSAAPISIFNPTYAGQKALASADPSKFMIGMPGTVASWQGNTAQQQVDWVKSDGVVGMAIWDLQLSNSAWNTDALWTSINTIRGAVTVGAPTVSITGGPTGTTTDQTPTFTWSGSDPDGSISKYYYSIDDATPNNQTTGTSYTSSSLAVGSHTFYVQAEDNTGNLSEIMSQGFYVSDGSAGPNLITNGDYANGGTDWTFYAHNYDPVWATGTGSVVGGQFVMQMTSAGDSIWHGQLTQSGINLENGKSYEVSFDAKSSSNRTIGWSLEQDVTWVSYGTGTFNTTTSMTNYSSTFTMTEATNANALFNISVGASTASVTVDNISIREVTLSGTTYTIAASAGSNGSISPTGNVTVNEGLSQSFSITPAGGYEIDVLTVNGSSVTASTSYTFNNVTSNQSISVTFKALPVGSVNFPFPQQLTYGTKPAIAQATLDSDIEARYDFWKTNYLVNEGGMYHVKALSTEGSKDVKTVSEAQGYGMMIAAVMAGYDANAKTYFDGLVAFYENYKRSNNLMDWRVWSDGTYDDGSAVDGDLDIAYAFILAYKQWGDAAYLTKAQAMIDKIWTEEMFYDSNLLPTPGDLWYTAGQNYGSTTVTRPSDWMAGHFKAFDDYSTRNWSGAASGVYSFYSSYSNATTGLVPDFFKGYSEAPAYEVEGANDGDYYYNACRVPLRFAMDYANNQNASANSALDKIGGWINTKSGGNANNIYSGYYLDGDLISGQNYTDVSFMGSFGAGLIATTHQSLMTNIWNEVKQDYMYEDWQTGNPQDNSYSASLGILSMLVMSGNWWNPSTATPTTYTITASVNGTGTITPLGSTVVSDGGSQSYTISADAGSQIDSIKVNGSKITVAGTYDFTNVTSNQTIEVWASTIPVVTYTITASSGSNGAISPTGVATVNSGSNASYTFNPTTGYEVADVKVNNVSQGALASYDFTNVTANQTIAVTFKIKTYTLTVSAGSNGTITPSSNVTVNYDGSQAFSINASSGYEIADVKIDNVSQGALANYTFSNVTANHTIAVTFQVKTYTITSSVNGAGSISPLGSSVINEGGSQAYTIAAEDAEASVDSVLVDGVNEGAITSYTFSNVTANHTIEAFTSRGLCDAPAWLNDGTKFSTGDIVSHNGSEWSSSRDNNTREPGVSWWTSLGNCNVYIPTVTTQVSTNHLTNVVNKIVRDSVVETNKDTTVTIRDLSITTDTSVTQTDTLWDAVYHSSSYDTILPPQVDTVVNSTNVVVLDYVPTLSATVTISHLTNTINKNTIDSVVETNKDTTVTTRDLDITTDTTVTTTDSLSDGVSFKIIIDTTLPPQIDTIVNSTNVTTLTYQPTVTVNNSVNHLTNMINKIAIDSVVEANKDTTVTTRDLSITTDTTVNQTDTLHDGVIVKTVLDTILPAQVDTVVNSTVITTLTYVPTLSATVTVSHLTHVINKSVTDSAIAPKTDTVVTTRNLAITTDTTVTTTDSLSDGVSFKIIIDTTLPPQIDTVITVTGSVTLPYQPIVTTSVNTNHLIVVANKSVADSVVQGNKDTVVTTRNLEITTDTTVNQTDTLHDGVIVKTVLDTLLPPQIDTVITVTGSVTLPYQPTITTAATMNQLVGVVTTQTVDSVVQADLDTIVTTEDLQITTDTTVITTDTLSDGLVFATSYDTTGITVDTVVTSSTEDTLVYTGSAVTLIYDTTVTLTFEYPQKVDSVVQANLDTVVTTSDLQISINTSVERTRTYVGPTLVNSVYDTLSVISDTVVLDSTEVTLGYSGTVNAAPQIAIIPDTIVYTNANFVYQVDATDGDAGETFIYNVEDGPAGMTISTGGQVIWLRDTTATLGSSLVTVIVTDSKGAADTTDFNFELQVDPTTPVAPRATTREPIMMWPNIVRTSNQFVLFRLPEDNTYRIRVFSALGDKVYDREGDCAEKEIRWMPRGLRSGQYLVVLETESLAGRQAVRRGMLGVQE